MVPPRVFTSKVISMGVDKALYIPFSVRGLLDFCERGTNQKTAEPWQPGGVRQVPLKGTSLLTPKVTVKQPK